MKRIIVFILAMVSILTTQAQKRKIADKEKSRVIAEKIKLSDEQKEKAKTINEDFKKKMVELRKKDDITVKEWRSQVMDLNKKHREEIKNLLNKEQKDQVEKIKIKNRKIADINSKAKLEKIKLHLDLNDKQAEKLKKQRREMTEKMKSIRENKSLDDQKKREEIRSLLDKRKENLKSVLREDQLKKMKEMREMKEIRKPMKKRRVLS